MQQYFDIRGLFTDITNELISYKDLIDFNGSLCSAINWAIKFYHASSAWLTGNTGHNHTSSTSTYLATPLYRNFKSVTGISGLDGILFTWEEITLNRTTGEQVITGKYYSYRGTVSSWSTIADTQSKNGIKRQAALIDLSEVMLAETTSDVNSTVCFFSIVGATIVGSVAEVRSANKLCLNLLTMSSSQLNPTVEFLLYEPSATPLVVRN